MKRVIYAIIAIIFVVCIVISCTKNTVSPQDPDESGEVLIVVEECKNMVACVYWKQGYVLNETNNCIYEVRVRGRSDKQSVTVDTEPNILQPHHRGYFTIKVFAPNRRCDYDLTVLYNTK